MSGRLGPDLSASVRAAGGPVSVVKLRSGGRAGDDVQVQERPRLVPVLDSGPADELWDVGQVSRFLRIPVATLRSWRCQGRGPAAAKLGRLVRYDPVEVRRWVAENVA